MGLYADHIFPWLLDHTEAKEMVEQRRLALREVRGDVLEIGIGTGMNIPYYPETVEELTALDPSGGGRNRALRRAEARGLKVEWRRGRGEQMPLDDEVFDTVVLVDVLCSVEDADAVLAEAYRVLTPGGRLHFLEHGLARQERVRVWQRRLNGFNRRTACGCELTRDPEKHLRGSSFQIDELVHVPPFAGTGALYPHIRGIAQRPRRP
jgi:ubiquinone/menaquinone biosynthesis C-methylase UbiE